MGRGGGLKLILFLTSGKVRCQFNILQELRGGNCIDLLQIEQMQP